MIETPKKAGYRMPAEYDPHHGTLMIWPTRPGSWPFQGKAAKRAFSQIIKTIKTLTNKTIYTTKEETRKNCKLKKGEFFYFDIIGCEIYENNQRLGEVKDIDTVGANHLFLIKTLLSK